MNQLIKFANTFARYESLYGQAGTLKFDLTGNNTVIMKTIWEDKTIIDTTHDIDFTEGKLCHITGKGQNKLEIEIPEYYSLSGTIEGNVKHIFGYVDAKLYGEVHLNIKGDFEANKIKSDECIISANNITMEKYIEAQVCTLVSLNKINIKKLAISKQAQLTAKNIDLKSFYAQSPENTLDIKAEHLKLGQAQGSININSFKAYIAMFSNSNIHIIADEVNAGIGINTHGTIKARNVKLTILDKAEINIHHNENPVNEHIHQRDIFIQSETLELTNTDNIFRIK